MKIVTALEAYELGSKRFYTSIVCKHGHDAERYVSNHGCVECAVRGPQLPLEATETNRRGNPMVKSRKCWHDIQASIAARYA